MSTFCGVTMVKDEADTIFGVLCHMASEGADLLLVLDNGSTDGTRALIDKAAAEVSATCEVRVFDDDEVGYYQSRKITAALTRAARDDQLGWVVPFDADELWHAGDVPLSVLFDHADERGVNLLTAKLLSHFVTGVDDDAVADPFQRLVWRERPVAPLPKIAFRWEHGAVVRQGNHAVQLATPVVDSDTSIAVRHFPYRSAEQFVQKARNGARAYAATRGLPRGMGDHWRSYGEILNRLGAQGLHDVWREHFYFLSPVDSKMVFDPAPYRRW